MKILSFGSMNIDYVYSVDHIVKPGETLSSSQKNTFPGGKGLNQSVALARAGLNVIHAGAVGNDGALLLEVLKQEGVNTEKIRKLNDLSGHTVIQVDKNGQNSIILFAGTNHSITIDYVDEVLNDMSEGDIIVLQNEISCLKEIIDKAYNKKMFIVFNPSPFENALLECGLEKVSLLAVNEIEGEQISGAPSTEPEKILDALSEKYPDCELILTLGEYGAWYCGRKERAFCPAEKVDAVDTTSAGDTFLGYFLAGRIMGKNVRECMKLASKASAVTVSRAGASASIPTISEIMI